MNGQNRLLSTEAARVINFITQSIQEKYTYLIWVVPALAILSVASHFLWRKKQKPFEIVRGNEPVSEKKYSVKDIRQLYLSSKK